MSSRASVAPVVALVVLVCVGCGSQSHTHTGSGHSKSLTAAVAQAAHGLLNESLAAQLAGHPRSKLVALADPACKRVAERRKDDNAAVRAASKSTAETLHALVRLAPGLAEEERDLARFLGAQKPSASEAHDWQAMVAGVRRLADDSTQIAVAAKANDVAAVHSVDVSGRLVRKQLAVIAGREGFAYCGPAI